MKPTGVSSINEQIERLARINADPDGDGITREVFTPEYMAAHDHVASLMAQAGLHVNNDAFGNLIGTLPGRDAGAASVMTGSHIDTTLNAGRYDGVVGVLGAIEAVALNLEQGWEPRRTIRVVCFAGEEPRFGTGCLGSRAMMGDLARSELDKFRDRNGVSIAEAMRSVGIDADRVLEARIDPTAVRAFVELHVEQGTVLESAGLPIGVVTRVAAAHDLQVTVRGFAAHAGATPMDSRRDALAGAAEMILELERVTAGSSSRSTVGTVGVIKVRPGAINVIPGEVELQVDVRDHDLSARNAAVEAMVSALEAITTRRGLEYEVSTLVENQPRLCSKLVIAAAVRACGELGLDHLEMTSGAYHDAVVLGARIPMGLIFIPSQRGISHSPLEFTSPEEIDSGVSVLARILRLLGERR